MNELTYNFVNKTAWGNGPWQSEPDKVQWVDKATGLDCLAVLHDSSGHWCGYVGVPEGHPNFQKDYEQVEPWPEVHGGLTFASFCHEGDEHGVCHVPAP